MNRAFFRWAAIAFLVAGAGVVTTAQVVLPPDPIMQPHLTADERNGLWLGTALGVAAVLLNFYAVLGGRPQPVAPVARRKERRAAPVGSLPVTRPSTPF